tara:strand:+ start:1141 stop:1956 length:816 start_codon:yes stop_codon:yes gene_type:complete
MKNIVITAAINLDLNQVEFFIKSFRKYSDDEIYFLVGKKDFDLKKKLQIYNCNFYEADVHKHDIILERHRHFLKMLEKRSDYDKALICDCRDLYFQSNPFKYSYKGSINFFSEDILIKKCPINSKWIQKTLGNKIYKEMENKAVCCAGTVIGSVNSMIAYEKLMIQLIERHPFKKSFKYLVTFRRDKEGRGCDQAYCNFIVHKKYLKNTYTYSNYEGPIATVLYLKNIMFNKNMELLNDLKEKYLIVHQYDKRWSEFSENIQLIKKNLKIA